MNKGYLVWIEYLEDRNYEFDCVYKDKQSAIQRQKKLMKLLEKEGYCIDWSEDGDYTIDDNCRVWIEDIEIKEN